MVRKKAVAVAVTISRPFFVISVFSVVETIALWSLTKLRSSSEPLRLCVEVVGLGSPINFARQSGSTSPSGRGYPRPCECAPGGTFACGHSMRMSCAAASSGGFAPSWPAIQWTVASSSIPQGVSNPPIRATTLLGQSHVSDEAVSVLVQAELDCEIDDKLAGAAFEPWSFDLGFGIWDWTADGVATSVFA